MKVNELPKTYHAIDFFDEDENQEPTHYDDHAKAFHTGDYSEIIKHNMCVWERERKNEV